MRIAYLVSQFLAVNHTYLVREVTTLRTLGFDILVISVSPPDRSLDQLAPAEREEAARTLNIKSTPLATTAWIHLLTLLSRPAGYLKGLVSAVRLGLPGISNTIHHLLYFGEAVIAGYWLTRNNIRHFHVHYSSTVGLLITRVFPLTMSITLHGRAEFVDPVSFHLPQKVNASSFVCAISNYARSRVLLYSDISFRSKVEVCRLGVDPSRYLPADRTSPGDPFQILAVGQLVPVKAHHVLIGAIARVVQEGANVILRLVGDGSDKDLLSAHAAALGIQDRVVFEGRVNHDRVPAFYRQADLFVLSSFDEGVPVVLMEAMAMEVPCVATQVAGIPELIRNGLDGLLVAPSDEDGLARAILQLFRDPDLRRRLSHSGRQRIIELFNLRRNCEELASIFRRRIPQR